ncbi:hypothetical protein GWK18_12865 [Kocuria sp. JC486]|uniref:Uncharacterized protein n=1 Tax=Kocuria soli TaxID=2485125 RepID=A0A3N4A9J7_9MICC|nr:MULTISPECIES: hypothetical protein [Kocuria]NHU86439.1 hypothetical protein [Kocuria sp. JC486]ROZ62293.1 hypothetical protein EDL96_10225 [Kocuria soli]
MNDSHNTNRQNQDESQAAPSSMDMAGTSQNRGEPAAGADQFNDTVDRKLQEDADPSQEADPSPLNEERPGMEEDEDSVVNPKNA